MIDEISHVFSYMLPHIEQAHVGLVQKLEKVVRVDRHGRGGQLLVDVVGLGEESQLLRHLFGQRRQLGLFFQQMLTSSVQRVALGRDKLVLLSKQL